MTRTLVLGLSALLLLALPGCARVVNDHVVGPHGEDMKEVQCSEISLCYDAAREACHGDYDIVQAQAESGRGLGTLMIVCST